MKHDLTFSDSTPKTLADVLGLLDTDSGLDAQSCREMKSAVNAVVKFAKLPASSVMIDISELRQLIEQVQPRRFKISARRLTNIRSLFVKALVHTGAPVEPLRLGAQLSPEWALLMESLRTPNDKNALTRFSQWCSLRAIGPHTVDDSVITLYRDALLSQSFILNGEKLVQNLVRTWNRSISGREGLPSIELTVVNRRKVFILPEASFPESFQQDLDTWCDRLAGSDLLDDQPFKPLRPVSVEWHRKCILRCASALNRSGTEVTSIIDLSVLVEPENAKLILRWFLSRNEDGKPSKQTHDVSAALMPLARHWVKLDEVSVQRLNAICGKCRVKSEGMTKKNRDTLRLFDDERLTRELLCLPERLMRRAVGGATISKRDAYLASQALAIAILTNAPIRIENLANININRNIVRLGTGSRAKVSLWFPAHKVKNDLEIELPLAAETVHLLDRYLKEAWPVLAQPGCTDLFPGRDGQTRSKVGFGMAIAKITERELGVRISPHQFRHIAGYLYLKACPGDYETVRVLLGHKSLQTTIQFYAGMEIAAAAKRYDEVVFAPSRKRRGNSL
jgi:Phage integrase family